MHRRRAPRTIRRSERFYRTVLSVLGGESSYAGADMVGRDDWWIGPTDREHPVTRGLQFGFRARGLDVGFRARDRARDRTQVDAFWQAGIDAGYPRRRRAGAARALRPDLVRRLPARS